MTCPRSTRLNALIAVLVCAAPAFGVRAAVADSTVVFLVRHAERLDDTPDSALSNAGRSRATELVHLLRSAGLEQVHSSDFARTRDTAGPVAAALGLNVQLYDPADLPPLADRLRILGGRHLVVGHSSTTPALVELLGGEAGAPTDETTEYDQLYVVTIGEDGAVRTVLLRYGEPYGSP